MTLTAVRPSFRAPFNGPEIHCVEQVLPSGWSGSSGSPDATITFGSNVLSWPWLILGPPTYSRWPQPRRNALDKELRWVKEYPLLPLRFVFSSGVSGLKVLRIHHMFRIQRSKQRHLKDLDSSCQVRTRYRLLTASIFAGGWDCLLPVSFASGDPEAKIIWVRCANP